MKSKLNKGFTLIEIIIVVVILGVLASVALPRLTAQVNKSRAAEAFNVLGVLMGKVSECYTLESEALGSCDTIAEITTATSFSFPTSSNFTYTYDTGTCTASTTCAAKAVASHGTGAITFSLNLDTGAITKSVGGDFSGLNK